MEGWKAIYQALVAVVLIFALYNVFIISNIHQRDDGILLKHRQDLLESEITELSRHLETLEKNQIEFTQLVQGVDQYIEQFKNRPRPETPQIENVPVHELIVNQLPVPDPVVPEAPVKIPEPENAPKNPTKFDPIPVLVIACNRPTVSRALDSIINARNHFTTAEFPILVSQDCGDSKTKSVIMQYSSNHEDIQFTEQLDRSDFPNAKRTHQGYFKLSRHYKYALDTVFKLFPNSPAVIIVEDDLEVSPDILSYFRRMSELLFDPNENLFCVSAWNDNGKDHQINNDPMLLHRTDFFGGLGWMLRRDIWENEWSEKWPAAYWDDWVRNPSQRQGRQCIRPEMPRTSTFGKVGVSGGQFFDNYLAKIHELHKWIDWNSFDLSSLKREKYDEIFLAKLASLPKISMSDLYSVSPAKLEELNAEAVVIQYSTEPEFVQAAKRLQIMYDFKAGVPRTGYKGVVSTMYNSVQIYLSPPDPATWAYIESW